MTLTRPAFLGRRQPSTKLTEVLAKLNIKLETDPPVSETSQDEEPAAEPKKAPAKVMISMTDTNIDIDI